MTMMHIYAYHAHHDDVYKKISPGYVEQAEDIQADGPRVESKYISEWHEGAAAGQKFVFQVGGQLVQTAIPAPGSLAQPLESRRSLLLAVAIMLRIKIESPCPESSLAGQRQIGGVHIGIRVELGALPSVKEEEVYLPVIVGQRALGRVAEHACHEGQGKYPPAPLKRCAWHVLRHEPQAKGQIDGKEPHIAREAIEYSAGQSLLPGEAGQLSCLLYTSPSPRDS